MKTLPKTSQSTRKTYSSSQTLVNRRKPQIMTVQKNNQPTKRLSQSQIDGTMFRLSKPAQIKSSVSSLSSTYEKYSTRSFREHPEDDDDLRSPKEKLMDYDNIEEGTSKETFIALTKQKILRSIQFGENSKEVVESHISLGRYYQNTDRPQSAIRHYEKGKQISQKTELQSQDSSTAISVGLAESHMALKQESKKHISQAASAISNASDCEVIDAQLHFRRDKIKAEIAYEQKDEKCCDYYITAEQTMIENSLEDESETTADFYLRIASVLSEYEKKDKIEKYARKASELYKKLDKEDKAFEAEQLIPPPEEKHEEEEEEKKNEEEDQNNNNNKSTEEFSEFSEFSKYSTNKQEEDEKKYNQSTDDFSEHESENVAKERSLSHESLNSHGTEESGLKGIIVDTIDKSQSSEEINKKDDEASSKPVVDIVDSIELSFSSEEKKIENFTHKENEEEEKKDEKSENENKEKEKEEENEHSESGLKGIILDAVEKPESSEEIKKDDAPPVTFQNL